MTQKNRNFVKVAFLVTLFFMSFTGVYSQESNNSKSKFNDNAIQNLKTAIQSGNPGLRKSGIYLAGKHSVKEVAETLTEQLKVESDPNTKILIMRVFYIFGEDQYMDDIKEVALNDSNSKVRKMANALYSAMQVEYSLNVAVTGS